MQLRDYQEETINALFAYFCNGGKGNPLALLPTGCHAKGHKILMFEGESKAVEDIVVGDLLMGPDSKPRKVLRLIRGRQEMRKITPVKGKSFVVNKDHKMLFYKTKESSTGEFDCYAPRYEVLTISHYESGSKWFKHLRKINKSKAIEMKKRQTCLSPYFLGLHLGDGSFSNGTVSFTNMDLELLDWYESYVNSFNLQVRKYKKTNNKAFQYVINKGYKGAEPGTFGVVKRHEIANLLNSIGLENKTSDDKFIPNEYKINSIEQRLELLAGILDSDGYLYNSCYEISTKGDVLCEDILFFLNHRLL